METHRGWLAISFELTVILPFQQSALRVTTRPAAITVTGCLDFVALLIGAPA